MSMHSCAVCATIFSTRGKFRPVSNFTKLHALTLAALLMRSCPLVILKVIYHLVRTLDDVNMMIQDIRHGSQV